ncbi:hypothetical protein ACP4OV_001951 [Aristida adscensionis]
MDQSYTMADAMGAVVRPSLLSLLASRAAAADLAIMPQMAQLQCPSSHHAPPPSSSRPGRCGIRVAASLIDIPHSGVRVGPSSSIEAVVELENYEAVNVDTLLPWPLSMLVSSGDFVGATSLPLKAKNGDTSLITEPMQNEQEKFEKALVKAEDGEEARERQQYSKLVSSWR